MSAALHNHTSSNLAARIEYLLRLAKLTHRVKAKLEGAEAALIRDRGEVIAAYKLMPLRPPSSIRLNAAALEGRPEQLYQRELARALGVSSTTIVKMVKDGRLPPPERMSRGCLYSRTQVEEWLNLFPPFEVSTFPEDIGKYMLNASVAHLVIDELEHLIASLDEIADLVDTFQHDIDGSRLVLSYRKGKIEQALSDVTRDHGGEAEEKQSFGMFKTELITIAEMVEQFGIARQTLHRLRKQVTFPKPVSVSPGSRLVRYRSSEVQTWLYARRQMPAEHEVANNDR